MDFICLQELGGLGAEPGPFGRSELRLGYRDFVAFTCTPQGGFRALAILVPAEMAFFVEKVVPYTASMLLVLKQGGIRTFLFSAHLPHSQRPDCGQVWADFNSELGAELGAARYHDIVLGGADLNVDVRGEVGTDERVVYVEDMVLDHALILSRPSCATWYNSRGSESRIDFAFYRAPRGRLIDDQVCEGPEHILGTDHRPVIITMSTAWGRLGKRKRIRNSKCGKWKVNLIQALHACNACAENLELSARDLNLTCLAEVCAESAGRATSCRYRDPPEIKQLIADRRALRGSEARMAAVSILQARKKAKATWLQDLLGQAAAGNFHAVSYFRRRGRVNSQMHGYILRAGGFERALSDLQAFYRRKFTPSEQYAPGAAMALYLSRTGSVPGCALFSEQEVAEVVYAMKAGKSAGPDGVVYEHLQVVMGSDLKVHFVEMLNAILLGEVDLPKAWMMSHVVFLPKTSSPAVPKDLRPIVLSSTVSKVFTRLLLHRLRPLFPPMTSGQIIGERGAQTLDAALAVQHAIRLSEERKQPLVVGQLDIAEAFDTVSHEAVASFLAAAGPSREGHLLLRLVTEASVTLQLAGVTGVQPLQRGIVQGAPYSAELFARIIDYHARGVHAGWQLHEDTWLQTCVCALLVIMYADDICLLATSCAQMARMVADLSGVLNSIGLRLAYPKCKFLKGCHVRDEVLHVGRERATFAHRFVFLGILMGFSLSCVDVLVHRLGRAAKTFHGFYRILCRGSAPVKKRLQLLDTFVTSKWRWMAPAIRPVSKVRKALDNLHLTYVTSIVRPQYDPFMSCLNNWTTRRRAARMVAHLVGHVAWSVAQAKHFFSYWGHVARLPLLSRRPVRLAMEVFGVHWTRRHEGIVLRQVGFWRNSVRFLQLAWEQVRHVREASFWVECAECRTSWRDVWSRWLSAKGWLHVGMVGDPLRENLMG